MNAKWRRGSDSHVTALWLHSSFGLRALRIISPRPPTATEWLGEESLSPQLQVESSLITIQAQKRNWATRSNCSSEGRASFCRQVPCCLMTLDRDQFNSREVFYLQEERGLVPGCFYFKSPWLWYHFALFFPETSTPGVLTKGSSRYSFARQRTSVQGNWI